MLFKYFSCWVYYSFTLSEQCSRFAETASDSHSITALALLRANQVWYIAHSQCGYHYCFYMNCTRQCLNLCAVATATTIVSCTSCRSPCLKQALISRAERRFCLRCTDHIAGMPFSADTYANKTILSIGRNKGKSDTRFEYHCGTVDFFHVHSSED